MRIHHISPGKWIGDERRAEVLDMVRAGDSAVQIGERLGFSASSVRKALKRWGEWEDTRRAIGDEWRDEILALVRSGLTAVKIGERLGFSVPSVRRSIKRW
jgi:DNA-binding CsgD family transcriptional regulator